MLKILVIVNAILLGTSAIASATDPGLSQSATDRHAPGNYVAASSHDTGGATSATARHAPGNYAPTK